MREVVEAEIAKYTKEYMRMSQREREIFDHQKQAKKDLFAIKKAHAKSNIVDDLKNLKREVDNLERDDEKKQKNRSFGKIQAFVAEEVERQEEERRKEMEEERKKRLALELNKKK